MKNFFKATTAILVTVFLVGCSSTPDPKPVERVVEPTKAVVEPTKAVEDHHEGETNVQPHDDDAPANAKDDHHEGETNVQPHDDEPSAAKPPSRSNPVNDHDDTGTEPHED